MSCHLDLNYSYLIILPVPRSSSCPFLMLPKWQSEPRCLRNFGFYALIRMNLISGHWTTWSAPLPQIQLQPHHLWDQEEKGLISEAASMPNWSRIKDPKASYSSRWFRTGNFRWWVRENFVLSYLLPLPVMTYFSPQGTQRLIYKLSECQISAVTLPLMLTSSHICSLIHLD